MDGDNLKFPIGKLGTTGTSARGNDLIRTVKMMILVFCISTFVQDNDSPQETTNMVNLPNNDAIQELLNAPPENAEAVINQQEPEENDFYNFGYLDVYRALGSTCTQPLLRGHCDLHMTRWGFRPEISACVRFTYSGCGGNSNNFVTRRQCESVCFHYI